MTTTNQTPIEVFDYYAITSYLPGLAQSPELMETPLQALLPVTNDLGDEITWYEQEEGLQTTTNSATISSGQTSVVQTTLYARVGDIILMDSERILVTAVTEGTKTLTVTRAYDSTSAAIHSAATTMYPMGNAQQGGATFTQSMSVKETQKTNYPQITTDRWSVTGSSKVTPAKFGAKTPENELRKAVARFKKNVEISLIFNENAIKQAGSTRGMTKGLAGFISTNSKAVTSSDIGGSGGSTLLTWDIANDWADLMANAGASKMAVLMGGTTAIAALREAMEADGTAIQVIAGTGQEYGVSFSGGLFRNGTRFVMITNRQMTAGDLFYLDASNPENAGMRLGLVVKRPLQFSPIVETGDFSGENLLAEYTLVLKEEKHFGRITAITGGA